MVRINLIKPKNLTDQHIIAEYNEILMLLSYINKNKDKQDISFYYCLGKGHMKFFKNKVFYLKKRHEKIKKEMKKRSFKTNKTINSEGYDKQELKNWRPSKKDKQLIKKRLVEKIELKPEYYKYYGKNKPLDFFIKLIKKG